MYHVQFPGLGLDFDINSKINFGGFSVYWYGIIIATGLILSVIYGILNSKRLGISSDKLLNCVIVGVITGIIGARTYYVAFQWEYYSAHINKILAINEGGLAIYGGIIGALIGGLITAKINKMNIPALLDVASVGFLIGQGIGRWGNFFNQEAYGIATNLPWGMLSEGTNNIAVHPCFLYESVWCLLGALLLHLFSHSKLRKYNGQMGLLYMVWYGIERTFVEGLRTDSLYIPNTSIRVSQIISIVITVAGLASLTILHIKKYEKIIPYTDDEIKIAKFKKPVYTSDNSIDENSTEISSHSTRILLQETDDEVKEEKISEETADEATEEKTSQEISDGATEKKTSEEIDNEENSNEEFTDINDIL